MAIEQSVWRIGERPQKLSKVVIENEDLLEEQIFQDVSILNDGWMLIGRQVRTDYDKRIDLLAVDAAGSLIVIELKKHRTARDVVAQAIDYGAWVGELDYSRISKIYEEYVAKYQLPAQTLPQAFANTFGSAISDDELNQSHQIVVVAAELDSSTERIVSYLSDSNVPINVVFFRVFRDGDAQYLSRVWMIDPGETQEKAATGKLKEPWNGEFYVSFGQGERRNWDDARRFGFISAGGGTWYSKTLNMLDEGDRIWVNIPKVGYVGRGIVVGEVTKASEFQVEVDCQSQPLTEASQLIDYSIFADEDDDHAEYLVPVEWVYTEPVEKAFTEIGLFGNQNSVCKPTSPKWTHTVDRLKEVWGVE